MKRCPLFIADLSATQTQCTRLKNLWDNTRQHTSVGQIKVSLGCRFASSPSPTKQEEIDGKGRGGVQISHSGQYFWFHRDLFSVPFLAQDKLVKLLKWFLLFHHASYKYTIKCSDSKLNDTSVSLVWYSFNTLWHCFF